MEKMYHIFSEGEFVLFRDYRDYVYFTNRFAATAFASDIAILGLTVMSTHFHAFVESRDDEVMEQFANDLHKKYAIYYARRYSYNLENRLAVKYLEATSAEMARNEMNYILKNSVHHYVSMSPMSYPYTSAYYLFMNEVVPPIISSMINSCLEKVSMIGNRKKRDCFGSVDVPDDWLLDKNGMVSPLSYVNSSHARAIWHNNAKAFNFDMGKNMADTTGRLINSDVLNLSVMSMSDSDLCGIIDNFSSEKGIDSFHHLAPGQMTKLLNHLKKLGLPPAQIRRCLWLSANYPM